MKASKYLYLLFAVVIFIVFKNFILGDVIAGGDKLYEFQSMLSNFSLFPYAWSSLIGNGLGGFNAPFLYDQVISFLTFILGVKLGFSWAIVEKIILLFPMLLVGLLSVGVLFSKIFKNSKFSIFASLIYLLNTYLLMVIAGGNFEIALSYLLLPFTLIYFFKFVKTFNLKSFLLLSLLLSAQAATDIRILYITFFAMFIYALIFFYSSNISYRQKLVRTLLTSFSPFIIVFLIYSYWIIPTLFVHENPLNNLGAAYTSTQAVNFFSFAKFEQTFSLLHPNWPENIFGKVDFMKPEFLLLPMLAYSSLFFLKKKNKQEKIYVLYFALLDLIGAFVAKGANDPFGSIYLFLFKHFPGFEMFRDSTKWYVLVAISYAVLIPFTIKEIYEFLQAKNKFSVFSFQFSVKIKNSFFNLQDIFVLVVIVYLLFLIKPALFGGLNGTLKNTQVPKDYSILEQFLDKQPEFYRTLWVPTTQTFGYYSNIHPQISGEDYFNNYNLNLFLQQINRQQTQHILQNTALKYIIVPYDSEGIIFLTDRKYDGKKYQKTILSLQKIKWLHQIPGFGKIAVFEVSNPKDHFWSTDGLLKISYRFVNPTRYDIFVQNAKAGDRLIFSESFDKLWMIGNLTQKGQVVRFGSSQPFERKFNSFILPKDGSYNLEVYYLPQQWVILGVFVSTVSLIVVLILLILSIFKAKK